MRGAPYIALAAVVAVIGLLAYGLTTTGASGPQVGEPAPDRTLPRLDGRGTGRLADHHGKWVLVNFWASWCGPCREESPALQRFHERHRKGFTVLGINTEDLTDDARAFVREFELTYPMLRDREAVLKDEFGLTGFPESFLIDPEGKIAYIRRGPVRERDLERFVAPFLEG